MTRNVGITKKELKALEKRIDAAYRKHGCGAQVPIMSLGEIFREVRNSVICGADLDESMQAEITRHRVN